MKEFINSVNAKSASLGKLLPVRICNSTVLGLVDSGNSFYNAISFAVATRIGLTYYQPYEGPPVGTAMAGSTLVIVGLSRILLSPSLANPANATLFLHDWSLLDTSHADSISRYHSW